MTTVSESGTDVAFSMDIESGGDVLALHGELDRATAPTLDAVVDLVGAGTRDLVLDLTDLQGIDSIGLTRLVRLKRKLGENGRRLFLRHPRPNILRVLVVSGLDGAVQIVREQPRARGKALASGPVTGATL